MKSVPLQWSEKVLFDDAAIQFDAQGHAYLHDLPPGLAKWVPNHHDNNAHACINYICPCGCGHLAAITAHKDAKVPNAWLWDGNVEKPTLSPSIQKLSTCRWHGYLRNGVWEEC